MDDYDELISKAPLKLKHAAESSKSKEKTGKIKKSKKKNHDRKDEKDSSKDVIATIVTTSTKAEQSFKAMQEKRAKERILMKASKTHKQRVEEFNKHLDSLTEHYDIPKVSWTK